MKVINDPLYGFVRVQHKLIYDIINHPFFQRLRFIKQLGLTDLVYPGALHTRFQHAIGAMHLTIRVLDELRKKSIEISESEYNATVLAVLLHDIGHGPFSHALEDELLLNTKHESVSYQFIRELNREFDGELDLTLRIYRNSYERKFFHQLVSSQLDMDRLDYLNRDCFFTGVMEGKIGVERILMLLSVYNDQLVIEEKGVYSVENFLTARRMMYWQVYLHKTTLSAERVLVNLIRRAKLLCRAGEKLTASDGLLWFLKQDWSIGEFQENSVVLKTYGMLDDSDIMGAVKLWQNHPDTILSLLSTMLLERRLFRIELGKDPVQREKIEDVRKKIAEVYGTLNAETPFLMSHGSVSNEAYALGDQINVLTKRGTLVDISDVSDLPTIQALSNIVKKNYLCWPKNVILQNS